MKAIFYDGDSLEWLDFGESLAVYETVETDEIIPLLALIENETAARCLYAAGYVAYEAAPAFDKALSVAFREDDFPPLAAFGLFSSPTRSAEFPLPSCAKPCYVSAFAPTVSRTEYVEGVETVRALLARGDTYQVNLTYRLEARFSGDPISWFAERIRDRPGSYLAYLEFPRFCVASLSPELFFDRSAPSPFSTLTFRPMKGTARPEAGRIDEIAASLRNDEKNLAENLMIVDMIRNDAGKISVPGSVTVPSLFEIERYPTVIQMTSTVAAETDRNLLGILGATFPCASITGAPKVKSMEIIGNLERDARGVYTGSIGLLRPDGSARFNVAIRTAIFDRARGIARYGTGGGIVWGSTAQGEFDETLVKTAALQDTGNFSVFESLLLRDGTIRLLERHLSRLVRSIRFFRFDAVGPGREGYDALAFAGSLRRALSEIAKSNGEGDYKLRVNVRPEHGPAFMPDVEITPVPPIPDDYTIALSRCSVDPDDPFTAHKTSYRHFIDAAVKSVCGIWKPGPADVALSNTNGELTETTRGNLVLQLDGTLWTPFLGAGTLPGTMREELLERGDIAERRLTNVDYFRADAVFMINSVRGMVECRRLDQ